MPHNRRARPTLRMLREDLTSGWDSPYPSRWLAKGAYEELHPLSELPHPIIAKAVECYGADPEGDDVIGPIHSSTQIRLWEIKSSQWRGAVWEDPESGVRWLVAVGLAKGGGDGGHDDHDDFYNTVAQEDESLKRVQREFNRKVIREKKDSAPPQHPWLPTKQDIRLLKRETAAWLRTEWELRVQRQILEALRDVHDGGTCRIDIAHPIADQGELARIDLTVAPVREDDDEVDEIVLEIVPASSRYIGSSLLWDLTTRVLSCINPPEQGWDPYKNTYSNIGEPGAWTARVAELGALVERNEVVVSEPGTTSHYTHRKHLADSTINGTAVRGLCGVFFVPTQDHESMPHCPTCDKRLAELPR